MDKAFFIIFLMVLGLQVRAQTNVDIVVDEKINQEMRMKNAQIDTTNIPGFRIQIFFGNDLQEAKATAAAFKARFPEFAQQVYLLYQQPYWKVRVGNFYREIDTQHLLAAVREFYPNAIVVNDGIHIPPISDYSE